MLSRFFKPIFQTRNSFFTTRVPQGARLVDGKTISFCSFNLFVRQQHKLVLTSPVEFMAIKKYLKNALMTHIQTAEINLSRQASERALIAKRRELLSKQLDLVEACHDEDSLVKLYHQEDSFKKTLDETLDLYIFNKHNALPWQTVRKEICSYIVQDTKPPVQGFRW